MSPPRDLQATPTSSTTISLTWIEVDPLDQNGIITMYDILYIPLQTFDGAIGSRTDRVSGSNTSMVLDQLQEYVNYNISIAAYTCVGRGPFSDVITILTLEDGKFKFSHMIFRCIKI